MPAVIFVVKKVQGLPKAYCYSEVRVVFPFFMYIEDFTTPGKIGPFTVYNVTPVLGGDCYLFVSDSTSFIFDSGYGFSAKKLYENIRAVLGERSLDYILLTHSHYDHAFGSAYIGLMYPECKVIAHEYAAYVFTREGAKRTMRRLDDAAAVSLGWEPDSSTVDALKADITLKHGESIMLGEHICIFKELIGHTKDSCGYYFPEVKMLLGSESAGVMADDNDRVLAVCLFDFDISLRSIEAEAALAPQYFFIPHQGMVEGEGFRRYIEVSKQSTLLTREVILAGIKEGLSDEEIIQKYLGIFLGDRVKLIYPEAAARENTQIMINMLRKSLE